MNEPVPFSRSAFPRDFVWGTATASYQIEGAVAEDGRGPSVWDTFAHTPGRVVDASSGDVACDHYHRWQSDLDLMASLGVGGYRFSIAWPRVLPRGRGAVERRGLDFYDRLLDGLLARGIQAYPTLFHWDLPQALQDEGGWQERSTAEAFAEYAGTLGERLGDRVATWWTLNEPVVHTLLGHALGTHAPGLTLLTDVFRVVHHQLLGHGWAVQALRAAGVGAPIGLVNNIAPAEPADPSSPADVAAARLLDGVYNRSYLDPVLRGHHPDDVVEALGVDTKCVRAGDLADIATPIDVLGVNYYFPNTVRASGPENPLGFELVPHSLTEASTQLGWPVLPDRLTTLLVDLAQTYGDVLPPIMVTESGCAVADEVAADGTVRDPFRIDYLDRHIRAVHAAIEAGVDVRGYFVWSFMDNFEWAEGLVPRFGLVHVDYETQRRTPKESFDWFRQLIRGTVP